ncbi:ankyrin repeat and MYND domain-containing protein 1 isoform X2 [Mesoplodon densirostris]|nr:ankyrin repeat and MYND domain-containing protein 1 isoform X2 [Mesoplodon densirostris]XP_059962518.1 ankyrin repeat and MYND domain-containing protein 1 isoform X2 [Mesoplodon densirostris]XP_059962519.1 ankyrin repeat and MYND domain-containing protein 1 isoform X2 [Mesoplodon densirostris]XP_059962520.1 ankyrin repeat and MYND domain-containing protein 1 isoform X2 [Mesoplodon densirostris]XP_059962521.1 ankyrin repeat and MYND domain-containing protein 1 isoform X2 [Mesoplodon densirost
MNEHRPPPPTTFTDSGGISRPSPFPFHSFSRKHPPPQPKPLHHEGLYKAVERFGPGVETYPDGSQDVGLWFHEHLMKLCVERPGSFSIRSYPEFSGFVAHMPAGITLSDEEKLEWALQEGRDPFSYDRKRFLLNDGLTLPPGTHICSAGDSHLPVTSSFRRDLDARISLNDIPPFAEDGEPWFIKNETPLMVKIQRQAYKFRNKRAHTSWNMGSILEGKWSGFTRHGPKERLSKEMILKAQEGNYDWIYGILRDNLANPDAAGAKGYTVLAVAAVHCHVDIVSLLLDNGADVNKCTDEGLTPLSMCSLLYYLTGSFKPNIAKRTVPEPQVSSWAPAARPWPLLTRAPCGGWHCPWSSRSRAGRGPWNLFRGSCVPGSTGRAFLDVGGLWAPYPLVCRDVPACGLCALPLGFRDRWMDWPVA